MISRLAGVVAVLLLLACGSWAEEQKVAPLKVLFITGGGYHDYKKQAPHLTGKIAELANVTFETKWDLAPMKDPKLGEGYDAIVYNLCFAQEKDPTLIANALKVTKEGKPTIMIHCTMHTFMASDDWTDCCGMRTRVHDPFQAFSATKAAPDHPIIKDFPENWKTAGDELYQTIKFGESSTALLKVISPSSKKEHIVSWASTYGKGKVFATTLGHDMKTLGDADFLKHVANGILWACDKLGKDGKPLPGYAGPGAK
ncbi:MAG: ThuA domain-containing protein [Planctomycetota bacterium]|nr:ThuA domain-containing protein [Planctomycetota bacterium]